MAHITHSLLLVLCEDLTLQLWEVFMEITMAYDLL